MKNVYFILMAIILFLVLSSGAMATMEIGKDVYGTSKGCTTCHTAVPKAGDQDKKLKPNQIAMKDCSSKTGKSCKGCHNGNPNPPDKCP